MEWLLQSKGVIGSERVYEAYLIILDAGEMERPLDLLNQLLDEPNRKLLKDAAARKLIQLGDSENFAAGYGTPERSAAYILEMPKCSRSFVERLAKWEW